MNQKIMNEAELQLKYLERWKSIRNILISQMEELKKLKTIKKENLNIGDSYILTKLQEDIEEIEKYKEVIDVYTFYINRLENAMNEVLSERQKKCCQLYANYNEEKNGLTNEINKLEFSRSSFYRLLRESYVVLNHVLKPSKFQVLGMNENEAI